MRGYEATEILITHVNLLVAKLLVMRRIRTCEIRGGGYVVLGTDWLAYFGPGNAEVTKNTAVTVVNLRLVWLSCGHIHV